MKKPYKFNEIDNTVICHTCNKPLKKNLITRHEDAGNPTPRKCYKCTLKDRLLTVPGISKPETRKIMKELAKNNKGLTRSGALVIIWGIQMIVYAILIAGMF
jgi:hypothetical protein